MQRILKYSTPAVRDLAWAILSPPLVLFTSSEFQQPGPSWCQDEFEAFRPQLDKLDQDPGSLNEALQRPPLGRLGTYFENLIAYWLEHSERFEVIERGLQIRDGGHTLGELDFVIRDRLTGRLAHWEVALKFYLLDGPKNALASWHGPRRRDRLDLKMTHIVERQAQRCKNTIVRQHLEALGIAIDDVFLFVKGRSFSALKRKKNEAEESSFESRASIDSQVKLNEERHESPWMTASEYLDLASSSNLLWHELKKPNWLCDQTGIDISASLVPAEEIAAMAKTRPIYVLATQDGREVQRAFIVHDSWSER